MTGANASPSAGNHQPASRSAGQYFVAAGIDAVDADRAGESGEMQKLALSDDIGHLAGLRWEGRPVGSGPLQPIAHLCGDFRDH